MEAAVAHRGDEQLLAGAVRVEVHVDLELGRPDGDPAHAEDAAQVALQDLDAVAAAQAGDVKAADHRTGSGTTRTSATSPSSTSSCRVSSPTSWLSRSRTRPRRPVRRECRGSGYGAPGLRSTPR